MMNFNKKIFCTILIVNLTTLIFAIQPKLVTYKSDYGIQSKTIYIDSIDFNVEAHYVFNEQEKKWHPYSKTDRKKDSTGLETFIYYNGNEKNDQWVPDSKFESLRKNGKDMFLSSYRWDKILNIWKGENMTENKYDESNRNVLGIKYAWHDKKNTWIIERKSENIFSPDGKCLESTVSGWDPQFDSVVKQKKYHYFYYLSKEAGFSCSRWSEGKKLWSNFSIDTTSYDSIGRIISHYYAEWNEHTNQYDTLKSDNYKYSSNGVLIFNAHIWWTQGHQIREGEQHEQIFDKNGRDSCSVDISYSWNEEDKKTTGNKKEEIYNINGQKVLFFNYKWNNELQYFDIENKETYTYNRDKSLVVKQVYNKDTQSKTLIISTQEIYNYDKEGRPISNKTLNYNNRTKEWKEPQLMCPII